MAPVKTVVFTLILILVPLSVQAAKDPLSIMDRWDYDDPVATRNEFRKLLSAANQSNDRNYLVSLLTQVARTYSIQGAYDTAHAELDGVAPLIEDQATSGYVFYLLERGRTWNSADEKEKAIPLFQEAFKTATEIGNDYLAVDAAHMLGIASPLDQQHEWNMKALGIAENSDSERAKNWLGSLYNNIGWTWFEQEEYVKALELFQKAVAFRREHDQPRRLQIAKWAVGRTLRAMGRTGRALEIQLALAEENERMGQPPDGYVMEELGELYLDRGDDRAGAYFSQAWEQLSNHAWLREHEPERLERLRKLADPPESELDQ